MTDNMLCFLSSVLLNISRQTPFFLPGKLCQISCTCYAVLQTITGSNESELSKSGLDVKIQWRTKDLTPDLCGKTKVKNKSWTFKPRVLRGDATSSHVGLRHTVNDNQQINKILKGVLFFFFSENKIQITFIQYYNYIQEWTIDTYMLFSFKGKAMGEIQTIQ